MGHPFYQLCIEVLATRSLLPSVSLVVISAPVRHALTGADMVPVTTQFLWLAHAIYSHDPTNVEWIRPLRNYLR